MYERPQSVRSPVSGPGSGRTTGPPPQSPTVHLSASRGRARCGKGATDKQEEDQETSDTYEEAEAVKRDATYTFADRKYRGAASGRQTFCSFIRSHRICIEAATVVVISLVAMGLCIMFFINNKAEPVRSPVSGPGSGRTTGPPPQSPTVHLSASRGRARYGKGAADKGEEDQETSDTYEEAEEVKRDATDTSADRKYRGAASGRQTFCSFIRSHRICIEAATVVVISLVAMGLCRHVLPQ
uniref:Uncharacterized protein n=1 Tax=Branchiostoma floridae TaxID=7739 RepID=C3XSZ1_BRAFL|eukprot:XP_002612850.1 hypothetical protein BRAFLDRAFT_67200 [Branchiostoma floridae]